MRKNILKWLIFIFLNLLIIFSAATLQKQSINEQMMVSFNLDDSFTQLVIPKTLYDSEKNESLLENLLETAEQTKMNLIFRKNFKGVQTISSEEVSLGENLDTKGTNIVTFMPFLNGSSTYDEIVETFAVSNQIQADIRFEEGVLDPNLYLFSTPIFVETKNQAELNTFVTLFLDKLNVSISNTEKEAFFEASPDFLTLQSTSSDFIYLIICSVFLLLFLIIWLIEQSQELAVNYLEGNSTVKIAWQLIIKHLWFYCLPIILVIDHFWLTGNLTFFLRSISILLIVSVFILVLIRLLRYVRILPLIKNVTNAKYIMYPLYLLKLFTLLNCSNVLFEVATIIMMTIMPSASDTLYDDYAVFFPYMIGNDSQLLSQYNTTDDIADSNDLYRQLEEKGMIFIKSYGYDREYRQEYQSITVNPNYLERFEIVNLYNQPLDISTEDSHKIILIPERNQSIIADFQQVYELNFPDDSIDYYIIRDGQSFPTLNPYQATIQDPESIIVNTYANTLNMKRARELASGMANEDPIKVKLNGTLEETYQSLTYNLEQSQLFDNLPSLVKVSQILNAKLRASIESLSTYVVSVSFFLGLLCLVIVYTLLMFFQLHYRDIAVKLLEGFPTNRIYRNLIFVIGLQYILAWAVLMQNAMVTNDRVLLNFILFSLFLFELLLTSIISRVLQKSSLNQYLKGF